MTNMSPRELVLAFIADITAAHAGEAIDPFRRFADDGVMIIPGTTPLSGEWRKPSFYTEFLPRAMQLMGTKPGQGLCVSRVIAEGNRVVVLARGRGSAISGRPYNNNYFLFFAVRDQEIVRYFEGFDASFAYQAIFDRYLRRPPTA
jgi:ketosteroid isomerase-like protein